MDDALQGLAVFDFDDTLITGDSLWPFLGYVAGWPRTVAALAESVAVYILKRLKDKNDPAIADRRTFLKAYLLHRLLAGYSMQALTDALEKLQRWKKWNMPVYQMLQDHQAKGHRIVIASGGLNLYLPQLLKELPAYDLICTEIGVKDGIVTGEMLSGNCVRQRKAELLADFIKTNGPFGPTWGYGNFPHDIPMMELLKYRVII